MAIHFKDCHFGGGRVGIKSDGPVDLIVENPTFDNVDVPFDITGANSVKISGARSQITTTPRQNTAAAGNARAGSQVSRRPCPCCALGAGASLPPNTTESTIRGGSKFGMRRNRVRLAISLKQSSPVAYS